MPGNGETEQITHGTTGCMLNFEPACYAFGKSDGDNKPPIYVQVGKNQPIKITYKDDHTIDKATELADDVIDEMNKEIAAAKAEGTLGVGDADEAANNENQLSRGGGARRKRRSNKRKPKKSAKKPKRSKKGKTRKQKK